MTQRLANLIAIVTGGSRGIGYAISEKFAREGAVVVIAAQNEERGAQAAQCIADAGERAEFIRTDVGERDQVDQMVDNVLDRWGRVDLLVNNAGVHESAPFVDEPEELWQRVYRVNVLGAAFASQKATRAMMERNDGGSIVHIASKAGVVGEPGHAAYSSSNGALIALTRAMAVELAPYGIRVNAICPGPVMTDILREAVPTEDARNELAADTPLGRIGRPEDVAHAACYLASSESDWCTGQTLNVDGGLSILK